MPEPKVLLSGLGIPESPRWHEGRLWFCNWIDRQVVAVGLDGQAEVMAVRDPDSYPMGYSIDWLPDGRLLVTGDKLRRQESDGSMVTHSEQGGNEVVVDGRGNIYLNGADFNNFTAGGTPKPGYINLITPDGQLRQVADDIQFPNGMVITPDNRTLIISESFAALGDADHRAICGADPTGESSPRDSARTVSASTPKARYGSAPQIARWSASPRAARSCGALSSRSTGRRSR